MKFDITLGLVDRPGQLLKALGPVAKNGGNIISIIHEREKLSGGYVPVSLVVDFPSREKFERARREIEELGILVIRSEEVSEKVYVTCILVGKVDVRKIVEAEAEGMRIVNFEVSSPTSKEVCMKLNLEVPAEALERIMDKLKKITEEENAILIPTV